MPGRLRFDLYDVIEALGMALDLVSSSIARPLSEHSRRVAYISIKIAETMGLSEREVRELYISALLHDSGLVSQKMFRFLRDIEWNGAQIHCEEGYRLFKGSRMLANTAHIIRSHHDRWVGQNVSGLEKDAIPLASRIIFVADRVDMLVNHEIPVLTQRERVEEWLKSQSGLFFDPGVVEAFKGVSQPDSFWFDLTSQFLRVRIEEMMPRGSVFCNVYEMRDLASAFAQVIDLKTPFTQTHSREVSRIAGMLARRFGFGDEESALMEVAGLLHDLGKLGIPDDVLDKPGKLDRDEAAIMRRHVYDTYVILRSIKGFEKATEWAAFHHERMDGSGYPFGYRAERLSLGSRIMAVADVFQALNQNRPYRPRMSREEVSRLMERYAAEGTLDRNVVAEVLGGYDDYAGYCEMPL